MRFDAPVEFQPFGAALSKQRRDEAEDGVIHRLARRLGALFESCVPQTPNLIKAYGKRASEIAASPEVNPKGSHKHGPFKPYVGADGTSIWAAATSMDSNAQSHPPLAMHLLACILARAWKAPEAVAIWVELVRNRCKEIESNLDSEPQPISTCMAARQDISRDQLALWDASARSWLHSADDASRVNRTRLQLLLNYMHLSFTHHKSTYESVISVWRNSMIGMEKAILGTPQEVSDGSVLLSLSAWHIYPNLIVLGLGFDSPSKISFDDPLVLPGGVVTVGLEFAPNSRNEGMHWSLVLNHLRYYGGEVQVESSDQGQRITMNQFFVLIFGNLLSSWNIPRNNSAEVSCANWLVQLSEHLQPFHEEQFYFSMTWLEAIFLSAKMFLSIRHENANMCSMLLSWGRRRCSKFMQSKFASPFFGLAYPRLIKSLASPNLMEAGIAYLRSLAAELGFTSHNAIIRYHEQASNYTEIITAVPHKCRHQNSSDLESELRHCRWLSSGDKLPVSNCLCEECNESCPCEETSDIFFRCKDSCHPHTSAPCKSQMPEIKERERFIVSELGEDIRRLRPGEISTRTRSSVVYSSPAIPEEVQRISLIWDDPPLLYHRAHELQECASLTDSRQCCLLFSSSTDSERDHGFAPFSLIHSDMDSLSLRTIVHLANDSKSDKPAVLGGKIKELLTEKPDKQFSTPLKPKELVAYLRYSASYHSHRLDAQLGHGKSVEMYHLGHLLQLASVTPISKAYSRSLRTMLYAVRVYNYLDGATIPLHVLDLELTKSAWVKVARSGHFVRPTNVQYGHDLMRSVQFACISMFESGTYQLDVRALEPVTVMASANSLFIAGELVMDPGKPIDQLIRRVTGNVGRAGISLLVLPQLPPQIRPLGYDWRAVPHEDYDGRRENAFPNTNLVLSFTEWTRPFQVHQRGTIDENVHFVECVVSVHDRGEWIADINPIGHMPERRELTCQCDDSAEVFDQNLISIDTWEELLDAPTGLGIFRARSNSFARLAAAAIRGQQGKDMRRLTWVVPSTQDKFCRSCLMKTFFAKTGSDFGIIVD